LDLDQLRKDCKPLIAELELWPKVYKAKEDSADHPYGYGLSALIALLGTTENKDERVLTAFLALLAAGQIELRQFPGIASPRT